MDTKNKSRASGQRKPAASSGSRKTAVHSGTKNTSRTGKRNANSRGAQATANAKGNIAARTVQRAKRPVRRPVQPKKAAPEVVYTQPEAFNRGRFILRLATVVAVVVALVFGMSIFFKVDTVLVSGADKYTPWDIREASGIRDGENLLGIGAPRISSKIKAALPYVDTVRVGITLPGTVNIEITELDVVYAIQANDDSWWLISSEGTVIDSATASDSGKYTQLQGVQLADPMVGSQAVAADEITEETQDTGLTLPVAVKGSEKLTAALSILQYLEGAGVIGDAASINVEDLTQIELWYGERYQVKLGDTTQLKYKIESMKSAIDQMTDYQTGVLDVSFTTWPDEVGYNPFS